MSETEWLGCCEPDLMLDELEGKISREKLVEFVRRCWERITPYLPPVRSEITVVEEFAAQAGQLSDHDAALYAYEAALKAARWAPVLREEQKQQAALLRQIVIVAPLNPVSISRAEAASRSAAPDCGPTLLN